MSLLRHDSHNWDDATSDEELVRLVQRGQREAFGVLYERHVRGVYGYSLRMLGEQEAAQDANSVVFSRALSGVSAFRAASPSGTFRRWLFAIAHNVIADELRGRRSTESLDSADLLLDSAPSPEERAISADELRTVMALLPQLSIDQGHTIALRLAGFSAVEIGEILGRPRNAIDGIHHRAVNRLKELVATGSEPANAGGFRHD